MTKTEEEIAKDLVSSIRTVADSIRPLNAMPGHDAAGGTIDSLTEAVMGVTSGLVMIAEALQEVASAIRDSK